MSQANGQPATPFVSPFPLMQAPDLIRKIHEAGYPREVILHHLDFAAIMQQLQAPGVNREADERAYIWFGNTKLYCAEPADRVLDLSDRSSSSVVLASPADVGATARLTPWDRPTP